MVSETLWRGRRVFLTGHTGFKGAWLSLMLQQMGAQIYGYALAPENPSLFTQANLSREIPGTLADIRDFEKLSAVLKAQQPEVIFHLAAQPLVRESYRDPLTTFATNVQGTANLLEAARGAPSVKAIVIVTTDKCYENHESASGYKETDRLGGHDPYSASKACAELVAASYRASFFSAPNSALLATARAGNVIGGGDYASDRLIPDAMRAFAAQQPLSVRHPQAVRPWQHVLDANSGYIALATALLNGARDKASAWNFGPPQASITAVSEVATALAEQWGDGATWRAQPDQNAPHETTLLTLDITKSLTHLNWQPRLTLADALKLTTAWHKKQNNNHDMLAFTRAQISAYLEILK